MIVSASELNVRSGPGVNFRRIGSLKKGDLVQVLEEHEGWSWVNPGSGWVSSRYLEPAVKLIRPVGLKGILETFGPAGQPACYNGRASLPAPLPLSWKPDSTAVRFTCHEKLAELFTEVFKALWARGQWVHLKEFGGCYAYRLKTASSTQLSTHSWGIAVDLNPKTNAFGTAGDMHPSVIKTFKEFGFVHLTRDPMHFQFASSY